MKAEEQPVNRKCIICGGKTLGGDLYCSRACVLEQQRRSYNGKTLRQLPIVVNSKRGAA